MRKLGLLFGFFVFISSLAVCGQAKAEDVVYLKDGSVIHGMITEEVPGVSIKIQTNDGNVFVYKMKAVAKITHSADNTENNGGENANTQAAPMAPRSHALVRDPNARFSKFGFLFNCGFWAPGGTKQFNDDLEAGTGDTSYDYLPGWGKAGLGIAWYTNNFSLKWDFQGTIQPNDYSTDYYYGGYYVGTTTIDTYILYGGTELEADLGLDMITNKDNVFTVYLPFIFGVWGEEYYIDAGSGNSDTFTGSCVDFGSGIGVRGFDSSNFVWDFQLVYRGSNGSYLVDSNNYKIPYVNGKYIYADVSGLDLNFTIGFLMQ